MIFTFIILELSIFRSRWSAATGTDQRTAKYDSERLARTHPGLAFWREECLDHRKSIYFTVSSSAPLSLLGSREFDWISALIYWIYFSPCVFLHSTACVYFINSFAKISLITPFSSTSQSWYSRLNFFRRFLIHVFSEILGRNLISKGKFVKKWNIAKSSWKITKPML